MNSLKREIPNLATLEKRLSEVFDNSIEDIFKNTGENRRGVVISRHYFITAGILCLYGFTFLLWFASTLSSTPEIIFIISIVVLTVLTVVFWLSFKKKERLFAQELNKLLIPIVAECLGQEIIYSENSTTYQAETEALLHESEIVSNYNTVYADDMYSLSTPYPLSVREIFVGRKQGREDITVFRGVLVLVQLPKTLSGITFISTEGDKGGFGHQSFWTGLKDIHNVVETQLEWNEFERDLHVASNDGTEARYILTPNFMLDLHTWWSEHKQNIRMVFKGDQLFILLPDSGTKIASSTVSAEKSELKKYVMSILSPLWRTITLVENIRL